MTAVFATGGWRLGIVLAVCALAPALAASPVPPPPATTLDRVSEAIARVVADRIGGKARATVTRLQTTYAGTAAIVASPEPGARTAAAARYVLFAGADRVGTAVATVHVDAQHVRARRPVARNESFASADLEEVVGPLPGELIRRLPALQDVIGARVRRHVAAGEAITASVMDVPLLVKSGDIVTVVVSMGAVEARGRGVASGSGREGDAIRVTPSGTRRSLKARIIGPGTVEIVQ
jgi:flagella basal body P-ring formation protein FlgA